MRIAHVVPSLDPAAGGPPVVVAYLAEAQSALGHQVSIACYESREAVTLSSGSTIAAGFTQETIPVGGFLERVFATQASARFADIFRSVDVVHIHGIWTPVLRVAAKVARALRVPYVISPHGMLDPWSMRQKRLKKQVALGLLYRRMIDGAKVIHALNDDEARLLAPLHLRPRVEIIPNGVNLSELSTLPPKGTFRSTLPGLADHPFILFLSRIHPKKGLDFLADAFAIVAKRDPAMHLVVAGPDDGAGEDFKASILSAGLSDRVHLPGPLYGPLKYGAFVDSACFCLPSRQEGFSVAITEAMACHTPVVISDSCHFPEVAVVGAGIITPLNATAIANAIVEVTQDPHRAITMGHAGATLVAERFTWEKVATRAIQIYLSITSKAS